MKKILVAGIMGFTLISCNKIEERIGAAVTEATEKVKQKAQNAVEETVRETMNESINSMTGLRDVQFNDVFKGSGNHIAKEVQGKKFKFPNGTEGFVFKYKADKAQLISFLENQSTTDESRSDKTARKTDGKSILSKINFIGKFLPANTVDPGFLEDIKNDRSIEYYKLKRFPNSSTIIYNPKNKTVLQYVEVEK